MALPAKRSDFKALLLKEESTYGSAVALSASTDGFRMFSENRDGVLFERTIAYDGNLGETDATFGPTKRAAQAGLAVQGNIPGRARGAGAAYSASVVPNVHRLLKACGYTASVTTTGGSEKWDYALDAASATPTSLTMELYALGDKWPVTGAIMSPSFTFDSKAPPVWTFATRGIYGTVVDSAVAAPTYPTDTIVPPLANSVTFVMGSFTTNAIVYGGSWNMNRSIDNPRVPITSDHLGFLGRSYAPTATVVIEATARVNSPYHTSAGLDPELLVTSGQNFAFSLTFGSTQYNKWKLSMPQAQATAARHVVRNGVACWEVDVAGYNSTGSTSDACAFVFD